MMCDICASRDTIIKKHHHNFEYKNHVIEFDADRRFCSKCGNLVYDSEFDNNASKKGISLYNQMYGIPGNDIITLRKKYGLSQEQLSKIIGCAKKTLISYELETSIPNDIYMITLKTLMDNPEVIIYLINSNKERFFDKEYTAITNKINFLNNSFDIKINIKPSIYNGFTKFELNKVINLILLLADNGILKTKLLKEMFYCDFLTYKNKGASITGLEYSKLPYGPVPNNFEYLLDVLLKNNNINYDIEYKNNYESHVISSNKKIDKSVFDKDELNIIESIKEYFKDYSTKEIVKYSHKEKAYTETDKLELISYDYAFDIELNEN